MIIIILFPLLVGAVSAQNRIVGGRDAAPGAYPWQGSMQVFNGTVYKHICGAALIDTHWAVTAAHCIPTDRRYLSVVFGAHSLSKVGQPGDHAERYQITDVFKHPQYMKGAGAFPNDIALLYFHNGGQSDDGGVRITDYVDTIRIAKKNQAFLHSIDCKITGWGYTDGRIYVTPDILQVGSTNVISRDVCDLYFSYGTVTDGNVCISEPGVSSCNGDSGGPLTCDGKTLVGVTSFGMSSCPTIYPAVYSEIQYFRDWIDETVARRTPWLEFE